VDCGHMFMWKWPVRELCSDWKQPTGFSYTGNFPGTAAGYSQL